MADNVGKRSWGEKENTVISTMLDYRLSQYAACTADLRGFFVSLKAFFLFGTCALNTIGDWRLSRLPLTTPPLTTHRSKIREIGSNLDSMQVLI